MINQHFLLLSKIIQIRSSEFVNLIIFFISYYVNTINSDFRIYSVFRILSFTKYVQEYIMNLYTLERV
nr:MAG TPA: hypothetical protein [Caudoviricetes sp.]